MGEHNLIDFLDNLIECDQALIPCNVIGVIKANPGGKGVVIESCRGEHLYTDSNISYKEFKKKLDDIRISLSAKRERTNNPLILGSDQLDNGLLRKGKVPNISQLPKPPMAVLDSGVGELTSLNGSVAPPVQKLQPPIRVERVMIPIDNLDLGAATGQLPHTSIVDRKTIVITSGAGLELGRAHPDGNGTIIGSNVSGIIFCRGGYQLVFKEYSASEAYISYDIPGEG